MTTTRKSNFAAGLRTVIMMALLGALLVALGYAIGGIQTATIFLVDRAGHQLHRLLVQRQDRPRERPGEAALRGGGPGDLPDGPRADDPGRPADAASVQDPE